MDEQKHGIWLNGRAWTRGEIAEGTGLSLSHVSRIFSGQRGMSMTSARKISGLCGVSIDQLYAAVTVSARVEAIAKNPIMRPDAPAPSSESR